MVLLALHARARVRSRRPRSAASAARSTGCWPCSRATAAGPPSTSTTTGQLLNQVPFADHNAMLDPTCPDITGRVLEALCRRGLRAQRSGRSRAAWSICCETQETDGSWYGRWGVNYIYGTFLALRGLRLAQDRAPRSAMCAAARVAALHPERRRRLGRKLRQLRRGPLRARAEHALADRLGAAGPAGRRRSRAPTALRRGIEYLLDTQKPDGTWDEALATGTGFPNVFYLNYTSTGTISRCWPSTTRAGPSRKRSARCAWCRNRSRPARSAERDRARRPRPALGVLDRHLDHRRIARSGLPASSATAAAFTTAAMRTASFTCSW